MVHLNLFDALLPFFEDGQAASGLVNPHHLAVEVLQLSSLNDSSHLRRFFCSEAPEARRLLSVLIRDLLHEKDQGIQGQIAEMLKFMMDLTCVSDMLERDLCLEVLYAEDTGALDELVVVPLREVADRGLPKEPAACFGLQLVCELLSWAVLHHGYRARVFVMRHGLAQQAARLLTSPQRFLQLAPVRLVRAMVATKEESYHRYLAKSSLFAPIMRNFELSLQPPASGGNLLVSATLELLEHIRIENYKVLVDHICKRHGTFMEGHASKFKTLQGLMLRHHQNLEYEAFPPEQHNSGGPLARVGPSRASGRTRSPGREDSDDDEAYFESLDDDDDEDVENSKPSKQDADDTGGSDAATSPQTPEVAKGGRSDACGEEAANRPVASRGLQGLLSNYREEGEDVAGNSNNTPKAEPTGEADAPAANTDVQKREEAAAEAVPGAGERDSVSSPGDSQEDQSSGALATEANSSTKAGNGTETGATKDGHDGTTDSAEVEPEASDAGERALNHAPKRQKTADAAP
jgi:hypothetical protein